jgi:hypothetical protein
MGRQKDKPAGQKPDNGEMRRRWGAWMKSGAFSRLGAQGLRMALWVQHHADWSECHVYVSIRDIARQMDLGTSTVSRGITELVKEGVLVLVRGGGQGRKSIYVVPNCAPVGCAAVPYGGAVVPGGREQVFHTGAQLFPNAGAVVPGGREQLRHHVEPISSRSMSISINTHGLTTTETAGAGRKPAPPLRQDRMIPDEEPGE